MYIILRTSPLICIITQLPPLLPIADTITTEHQNLQPVIRTVTSERPQSQRPDLRVAEIVQCYKGDFVKQLTSLSRRLEWCCTWVLP